jgi:hypothetical protein
MQRFEEGPGDFHIACFSRTKHIPATQLLYLVQPDLQIGAFNVMCSTRTRSLQTYGTNRCRLRKNSFRLTAPCIGPRLLDLDSSWRSRSQLHAPAALPLRERVHYKHRIRNWVGTRSGLNGVVSRTFLTIPGLELRPLYRPIHSKSIYRLRYPGSCISSTRFT